MDNSPRNPYLDRGGEGVDISAQMVHFARNLAEIYDQLHMKDEAKEFGKKADQLAQLINEKILGSELMRRGMRSPGGSTPWSGPDASDFVSTIIHFP